MRKVVAQKVDERIEHGAGDHEPVQQKQGFAVVHDLIEDSVRCAVFPGVSRHGRSVANWRAPYREAAPEMQVSACRAVISIKAERYKFDWMSVPSRDEEGAPPMPRAAESRTEAREAA